MVVETQSKHGVIAPDARLIVPDGELIKDHPGVMLIKDHLDEDLANGNGNDGGNSSGGEEIENVHRLVQDENAKTILLNVPLEDQSAPNTPSKNSSSSFTTSKPPRRPAASPRPGQSSLPQATTSSDAATRRATPTNDATRRKLSTKSLPAVSSSRVRSASVGRDKHSDTQARYWAFLFENLRRAVDDLYRTCESDESIPAVKEVILVFENYVRDFRNLADWLKLNREYENTPPPQRPTSLAWEVRKTPPASGPSALAKLTPTSALVAQRLLMATPAKRALDFDDMKETASNVDIANKKNGDVSETIREVDVTPNDDNRVTPNDDNKENSSTKFNQVSETIDENVALKTKDTAVFNDESQTNDTSLVIKDDPIIVEVKADLARVQSLLLPTEQNDLDTVSPKSAEQPHDEESQSKITTEPNSSKPEQKSYKEKVVNGTNVSPKSGSPKTSKSVHSLTTTTTTTTTASYAATTSNRSVVSSAMSKNVTSAVKSTTTRPTIANSNVAGKTIPASTRAGVTATTVVKSAKTTNPTSTLAKTKSNSSSNLYHSRDSTTNNCNKPVNGKVWSENNPSKECRQNRVSLVARQTRVASGSTAVFASNCNTPQKTSGLMTRSATSATLSNRGRIVAFGRGAVMSSNTSSRGGVHGQQHHSGRTDNRMTGSSSNPQAATISNSTTGTASRTGQAIPFGSTSSVSSSSSNRSWADTVKGIPMAPRSVEDLSVVKAALGLQNDDDVGWEMVRPRTRSKFSPSNSFKPHKSGKHDSLRLSEQPVGSFRIRHSAKGRFDAPSSAVSLPSIALMSTEDKEEYGGNRPRRKSDHSPEKRRALKPVKSTSGLLRRDRPNHLERISGSDTGSSESSAENLHLTNSKPKLKRSVSTKLKDDTTNSVKKGSSKKENKARSESPKKSPGKSKLESVKSPSPPPSQDDDVLSDVMSDVMDSEIAKRDVAIARAEEEERCLAREIMEMEKSEMPDIDTDGDQASNGEDFESDRKSPPLSSGQVTPPSRSYSGLFEGLSWADEIDLEEQLQESRYPGRAIQIHEKLSSPARKREPLEAFRHHQEKQKNAKIRREKFQEEKASKLLTLNARIEEVIAQKMFLIQEKRDMLDTKMAKAELKRQEHIDGIRKKAREEDAKLKEIAFINELQAQNARIDAMAQNQTADVKVEERLAELAEERHKKQEQREAKEARAEERRKAMEEKRLKDMEALKERIRSREERIMEEQELARKERQEAAREKARDREEKLSTVRAAERDMKEELHEKIVQKHQEAARRHQEKLEHIRQKAFELSVQRCDDEAVPKLKPYDPKKKCSLCLVLINNEVHLQSHLKGRKHAEKVSQVNEGRKLTREELQSCNIKYILDAPADERDPKIVESKERLKAMKKKAKKLKARMLARSVDYETNLTLISSAKCDAPNRAKIGKSLRDIEKVFGSQGKGAWPNNAVSAVERALGELLRTFEKNHHQDKLAFYAQDGFGILSKLFNLLAEQRQSCVVPLKSIALCCRVWTLASSGHRHNTEFVLKNNHLTTLVDILLDRLQILIPDSMLEDLEVPPPQGPQVDPVAKAIMALLAQALEDLCAHLREEGKTVEQSRPVDLTVRAQDQISYIVSVGIVDKLASYFHSVQDPIEGRPEVGEFLLSALQLVSALTGIVEAFKTDVPNDPTHLWTALQVTDLAGIVSMLYGMLLHQGGSTRDADAPPCKLPEHTMSVACASLQLLHSMVRQRLTMVQEVLGQECISLEFRHIASYLLWYCHSHNVTDLLHLTIVLVGYFAAKNTDNQVIVQSGQQPSVLQQLCNLPFVYFSQPDLKRILFPTLLACCHENDENTGILTEEMNWQLIDDFLKSPDGKMHLVELVLS